MTNDVLGFCKNTMENPPVGSGEDSKANVTPPTSLGTVIVPISKKKNRKDIIKLKRGL